MIYLLREIMNDEFKKESILVFIFNLRSSCTNLKNHAHFVLN